MSAEDDITRPDPRARPDDPAGTKPKVDPDSLLPEVRTPLVTPRADAEADAYEIDADPDPDLLPERMAAMGAAVRPVDSPHSPKFQFLLGALFAFGVAAVVAVIVLAVKGVPAKSPEPPWSSWKPTGPDAPAQIAAHVAPRYTTDDGQQLVNVTGGPLEVQQTPIQLILDSGLHYFPIGGKGVLYNMCGIGAKDCRISTGKPSLERSLLLRREIVELALYTFHYTDADNVVTVMPLTVNARTHKFASHQNQAVVLQRADLKKQLDQPLTRTLAPTTPRVSTITSSPDAGFVNTLTTARSFKFKFQAAGTDGGYMVLEQPS